MEPPARHAQMMAPGASASTPLRCPAPERAWPRLDDHIAQREDDPDQYYEYLDGQRISAMANEEHAEPQTQLAYVLRAAVAPGYRDLVELTTRHDVDQDFATDACVLKQGKDPRTGERYLEELAFEVVNEETMAHARRKAEVMTRRGVRRVFAIWVKKGQVLEWSAQRGRFEPLWPEGEISDPSLLRPVPVRAILDAAAADLVVLQGLLGRNDPRLDDEAARALVARGNPVIEDLRARGEAAGQRQAVLDLCEVLGIELSPERRAFIEQQDLQGLGALRAHLKQHRAWPR